MAKIRGFCRGVFLAASFACIIISIAGCTRAFYRDSADREVNGVLREKDKMENARIEQYHVYPDPRSRYADPRNPDHPPMPPDDPDAWNLGPHPQKPGHRGAGDVQGTGYIEMIKVWDEQNREERVVQAAKDVERSRHPIKTYLDQPLNAKQKGFLLKMDQSIELGVINSPTYQLFREELYLAALPVTQQRYNYAYQWAATADWIRQWAGPESNVGSQNNWTGSSTLGFSKLFATGALLTADFANTTVFNFNGGGLASGSVINANFTQPFLQGGGRAVTLEPLAQAERHLVYSIRAYARFREQYNVAIALGANLPGDLPSAVGSPSGGNPISVLQALGIASTDVSGGFVGYLSTLFRECDTAVDEKYAADLAEFYKIIEAYQEGGFYSPLQVDQVRSTLLTARYNVLVDKQNVNNALDQFKLVLGLPANLPLILDDTAARPITRIYDTYYEVIGDSGDASRRLEKKEKQELLSAKEMRAFLLEMFTNEKTDPLVRNTEFARKAPASWQVWRDTPAKNFQDRMENYSKQRRDLFDLKTDVELKGQTFSDANERKLIEASFEYDLGSLEKELRKYDQEPWAKLPKGKSADKQAEMARLVVQKAKDVLVYPRNQRFEAVLKRWPKATPTMLGDFNLVEADVDLAQEIAVKEALSKRLDLMNTRAQVVDAWRQLRVTANALMGVATASYALQAQTAPGGVRPLAFSSQGVNQQLNLNFQLPLNRLAQRNAYRAALIEYQVARRGLMNLEDSIAAQVRFDVRQLQLFAANYAIQQRVIHSLYKQVDSALDVIVAPTDPDALKGSGTSVQANAAALTSQYLGALGGLNGAQTRMYDIWLSLYATRMQLYLDLERLPLDLRGVWTEESSYLPVADRVAVPQQPGREVIRAEGLQPVEIEVVPAGAGTSRPVFLAPRVAPD